MQELKYSKNIITHTKEYTPEQIAEFEKIRKSQPPAESTIEMLRLLWLDNTTVKDASMYMECVWLLGGETISGSSGSHHIHDFEEVVGFIGTDPDNPGDLGGCMEMVLGDETHKLTKSCLLHIPAGMGHCPLTFKKVDRPIFFFSLAPTSEYDTLSRTTDPDFEEKRKRTGYVPPAEPDESGTKYGRYIITEPMSHAPSGAPKPPGHDARTSHMVSLDNDISKGGFYTDFVWIWEGNMVMSPEAHVHDFDEIIGIVGFDPINFSDNPRNIDGEVSIIMDGDKYDLTKSSIVYVPKGVAHCPLEFKNIRKPVLCFTVANTPKWQTK